MFASASADNIKKFSLPKGEFMHNMLQVFKQRSSWIMHSCLLLQSCSSEIHLKSLSKRLINAWLSTRMECWLQQATMEVCGSGTGKAVIIFSKRRPSCSQVRWIARLASTPFPMISHWYKAGDL